MARTFEDISKEVVNRFLQNILFIDDKAYQSDNKENEFDANKISKVFAKEGKLYTIYAPSTEGDLCACSSLFSKSDVIVLDWYLDLKTEKQEIDADADADADEPRGYYTKKLIEEIVIDAKEDKLKLVIIYTGETDLHAITKDIYELIHKYGNFSLDDCCVSSANVLILICAKYNGDEQFKHLGELKSKVVKYEELPNFITTVFARFVNGLLSNFALSAISCIREQTSKILGVYSNKIDCAYLGHRVLLNSQSDAFQLLMKIFGDSMSDLVSSSHTKDENWVYLWVESRFTESKSFKIGEKHIKVDDNLLKELLIDGTETYQDKIKRLFNGSLSVKEAIKKSTCLFSADENIANNSNAKFAILTHHKNIFGYKPDRPILTLGTIVLNDDNYYVCIQQRCDSVRLKEVRKFLFLPLSKTDGNIHVVIDENNHLNVSVASYDLKTVRFKPSNGENCIYANAIEEYGKKKLIFESIYGEKYEWILELKDLHAQRIANAYSSTLSRVGLDESEWLRHL